MKFVTEGRHSAEFLHLPRALDNTALAQIVQVGAWNPNIRVSRDFNRVVVSYPLSRDQFLRAPHWIVSCVVPPNEHDGDNEDEQQPHTSLLIISAFEANELMPAFRRGTSCVRTRLHMFAARLHDTQSTLFHDTLLSLPADHSPPLPYSELLDPELLLFSGSIYFEGREEERAYCRFLGLRPHPRTTPNTPDGASAAASTTFCGSSCPYGNELHSICGPHAAATSSGTRLSSPKRSCRPDWNGCRLGLIWRQSYCALETTLIKYNYDY